MKMDGPREQLPRGVAWSMVDLIPEVDAPLAKRGGWNRPWDAMANTYAAGLGFGQFHAGSQIVGVTDLGNLYTMTVGSATVTAKGTVPIPAAPPTYYRNKLYFPDINGTAVLKEYDGSAAAANTAGTPPTGSVACAFKDHLVLARSDALKQRIWFSSAGSPTSWDTADPGGQWLDATFPVRGLASMRNMILVFEEGFTERIRGDIIPGVAGSDMVREPAFAIGCSDPGSIAVTDNYVVFANSDGVFVTDGIGVSDLTKEGGIKRLWTSLLSGYAASWTIAGAVHQGRYIVSVMDGATFKCAFMCEVQRRVWTRLTNVKSIMMVSTPLGLLDTAPAVYMAERAAPRVSALTSMFTPSATYKNDGDGTAVTWTAELGHFYGKPGRKRWRNVYVKYYMADAATDNPTLTVSRATDLAAGSYTALSTTLAENTVHARKRLPLRVASEGVALRIAQTNASSQTLLYAVEAEPLTGEPSRS